MTERFKKAVRKYVADCILTSEEKEDLMKIAKEDGINENDARIYMNAELKRKISRKQKLKDVGEVLNEVGKFGLGILTVAGGILAGLAALQNAKNNISEKK